MTFGQLTGSGSSSADAEQANIQPLLPENEVIFVHIPADLQSPAMKKACLGIVDPVFRLLRPLYGLPRSGNIWEKYVSEKLKTINWARIPEWPQTYFKDGPKGRMILTIYVDDFVMAGWGHESEWDSIRKLIRTTEPAPVGRILGVHLSQLAPTELGSKVVQTIADMSDYARSTVDLYKAVKGAPVLQLGCETPWSDPSPAQLGCVKLKEAGVLAPFAASLLMKALYLGRMMRIDLCWTINTLARCITRWTKLQDMQTCRLFSYMAHTVGFRLCGTVAPADVASVRLVAYPDADLAGAYDTAKSTSGGLLALEGPCGTTAILEWYSKKQTATSHSTMEAEFVSASKMLREHAIPQQILWEVMLKRPVAMTVCEDNESTIAVIESGFSPQLRHLAKTHRISLSVVHDICQPENHVEVEHIGSALQKGDLLTKGLDRVKHLAALDLVGLRSSKSE